MLSLLNQLQPVISLYPCFSQRQPLPVACTVVGSSSIMTPFLNVSIRGKRATQPCLGYLAGTFSPFSTARRLSLVVCSLVSVCHVGGLPSRRPVIFRANLASPEVRA